MKQVALLLAVVVTTAGAIALLVPVVGHAEGEVSPIYGGAIPDGYRDWRLISVNHLEAGKVTQLRAQLGNDIAMKAYREGTIPFPDGAIIAALHWNYVSSEDNKALAHSMPNLSLPGLP
jgi:Cytochrome P460